MGGDRVTGKIYWLIPLTVFWVIWNERKMSVFDGIDSNLYKIRDR